MIGTSADSCLIILVASSPSKLGILMSINIRSGFTSSLHKAHTLTNTTGIQDTETGTNSHLPGEAVGTQPSEVLPAKEETTEKEEDLRATAAGTEKATILIAEDTDSNFDLLNAILGRKYRLVRARDGMEAVTMYDEVNPRTVA